MNEADRPLVGRMLLGAALRRHRQAAGLNLDGLAERAGLSLSYLSDVERGRKLMSLDALDACADALGLLVTDLLRDVYPYGQRRRPATVAPPPDGRRGAGDAR